MRLESRLACAARAVVVIPMLAAVAGCGGSVGSTPTAPTGPAPASLTLAAASSAALRVGVTETLSIAAIGPDGVATPVPALEARWATDAPSLLGVTPTGSVTGLAAGRATVTATYRGVSGALPLRIVPNVHGAWTGVGHLTACDGFWDSRSCAYYFPTASTSQLTLLLVQDGEQVTADFTLELIPPPTATAKERSQYVATLSGTFLEDGTLTLTGPVSPVRTSTPVPAGTIVGWRTNHSGGTGAGTFTHMWPEWDTWGHVGRVVWVIDELHR